MEIGEPRFVPAFGAATDGNMIMAANVMVRCLNGATYPAQTGPTNWWWCDKWADAKKMVEIAQICWIEIAAENVALTAIWWYD